MSIQIVVSNDMWNEKNHAQQANAYDDLNVYVHFDQPISHALEYIENDVTNFWLQASTNGEHIATIKANKILTELMNEAKNFQSGKFKFPLCTLPNALSQKYHAIFAQKMASLPAGTYTIELSFYTDNPLQEGKILAQNTFQFELSEDAKTHLQRVAEENIAQGADVEDDVAAKQAAFERIKQGAVQLDSTQLTLINRGAGDIWVMIGYNSGKKYLVGYQQSIQVQAPTGETIYKYEDNQCLTNYGMISKKHTEQTFEVW